MAEDDDIEMDDDDIDVEMDDDGTDIGRGLGEDEISDDFESRARQELDTYNAEIEQLKGQKLEEGQSPDDFKRLDEKKKMVDAELQKLKNQAGDEVLKRDIRTQLDELREDIRQAAQG